MSRVARKADAEKTSFVEGRLDSLHFPDYMTISHDTRIFKVQDANA